MNTYVTSPVPRNSPEISDLDEYEDLILEEYMNMTEGDPHGTASGPIHPSHFSETSPKHFQEGTWTLGKPNHNDQEQQSIKLNYGEQIVKIANSCKHETTPKQYDYHDSHKQNSTLAMKSANNQNPFVAEHHLILTNQRTDLKFEPATSDNWAAGALSAELGLPPMSNWWPTQTRLVDDNDGNNQTQKAPWKPDQNPQLVPLSLNSSEDSDSDNLLIDECSEEYEKRPTVIVEGSNSNVRAILASAAEPQLHEWQKQFNNRTFPVASFKQDRVNPQMRHTGEERSLQQIHIGGPRELYGCNPWLRAHDPMWSQPQDLLPDIHSPFAPDTLRTTQTSTADKGLFQYTCNKPNCPGDISLHFKEFPFPRRKSANRIPPNAKFNQATMEETTPEFEIEPNQDEQRLILRRMRNREAAKKCRKKKKQEFISLLCRRAMLLAEYHKFYHMYECNTTKPR